MQLNTINKSTKLITVWQPTQCHSSFFFHFFIFSEKQERYMHGPSNSFPRQFGSVAVMWTGL